MAKPKLALIPATQGSKLYSVLPADGVGDFNFSRNSAATRINKDGLIETVAVGSSRLNYPLIDGVVNGCPSHLLEPQRTNLITYSEDFSNTSWGKISTTINSNQAISPDGTLNADKLVENSSNTSHYLQKTITTTSGIDYTFSFFVKKSERSNIRVSRAGGSTAVYFNLNNFTVLNSGSGVGKIELFNNNWVKCSFTFPTNSTSTNLRIELKTFQGTAVEGYQGDGSSGLYLWGIQLEQGSYPTSYIKSNSGTTTTRVAETASGSGDASTFNDSEGVLMAEISALADDGTTKVLSISDGGNATNVVRIGYSTTSNQINTRLIVNSVATQFNYVGNTLNQNKIALKWKLNDTALWVNGLEVDTDLSFNTFSLNTLNVLNLSNGNGTSNPFYGNTKQIQYFDSALNDSDLEKITSWTSFTDLANGQLYSIK